MFDIVVVYQHIGVMLVGGIVHLERHRAPRETRHRAPTLTPLCTWDTSKVGPFANGTNGGVFSLGLKPFANGRVPFTNGSCMQTGGNISVLSR